MGYRVLCLGEEYVFFSSRRRHTRYWRDWSSDVCSSDLWLGLQRWISYLIVWAFFVLLAAVAALVGRSKLKKIEKPERTLETLRDLPEVVHREAPGQRRREVPTVSNGRDRKSTRLNSSHANISYAVF